MEIVQYYDGKILPSYARNAMAKTIALLPCGWTYRLLSFPIVTPFSHLEIKHCSSYFRACYLAENPFSFWLDWDCYPLLDFGVINFETNRPYCAAEDTCRAAILFPNGRADIMKILRDSFQAESTCICAKVHEMRKEFNVFPKESYHHFSKEEKAL
jgi:hypothetical protein